MTDTEHSHPKGTLRYLEAFDTGLNWPFRVVVESQGPSFSWKDGSYSHTDWIIVASNHKHGFYTVGGRLRLTEQDLVPLEETR
jgi:hypothetical protein